MNPKVGIVVVAAGSGTRLGGTEPKAFAQLGDGTVLAHSLRRVFSAQEAMQVVVVAPGDYLAKAKAIAVGVAGGAAEYLRVVPGGKTRQDSVAAGLGALADSVQYVLVHDAARALTPAALIDRVVLAVGENKNFGVIPVLPVVDTLKQVDRTRVIDTVDRSSLFHVQTPQAFPRRSLQAAYAASTAEYTDDAALFQAHDGQVLTVVGEERAFKITNPWDLRRAARLLNPFGAVRTGIGVDVHRYDAGVPLWLGGIHFPGEAGLSGHSDGDAVIHAVCDALLSAASLGDLGANFGTDDPQFAGAFSSIFLSETLAKIGRSGYRVQNVAVQIIANRPRLSAKRIEMEKNLSELVGAPVSVAATTSDGLGFTGHGDGLAAIATALLGVGG